MISSKKIYHEVPVGFRKILHLNWPVLLLVITTSNFGFLILYSVAEGNLKPWAEPQIIRFGVGFVIILLFSYIHINEAKKIKIDYYCSLASLPLAFNTTIDTIPIDFINIPNRTWNEETSLNVRDLWKHKNLGVHRGHYNAINLASHGSMALLLYSSVFFETNSSISIAFSKLEQTLFA